MLELGHAAEMLHRQAGRCAAVKRYRRVDCGAAARPVSWPKKPCARACRHIPCIFLNMPERPAASCGRLLQPGDAVLFKGIARRAHRTGHGESPGVIMLYFLLYEKLSPSFRHSACSATYVAYGVFQPDCVVLCIALGPWLIGKLRQFQIGQYIREEARSRTRRRQAHPPWAAC